MALGTIDIQYIDNKFAGKVGVGTFFASWMSVHFVVSMVVDAIFWILGKDKNHLENLMPRQDRLVKVVIFNVSLINQIFGLGAVRKPHLPGL